jgi:uncharacterized membrane protein
MELLRSCKILQNATRLRFLFLVHMRHVINNNCQIASCVITVMVIYHELITFDMMYIPMRPWYIVRMPPQFVTRFSKVFIEDLALLRLAPCSFYLKSWPCIHYLKVSVISISKITYPDGASQQNESDDELNRLEKDYGSEKHIQCRCLQFF